MDVRDATEQAYKNGYRKGVEDLAEKLTNMCSDPFWCVWMSDISAALEELLKN